MAATYSVYILECKDGSFYTGIATDVARRFAEHSAGTGAKYTRSRGVVRVVYCALCGSRSEAQKQEARIKRMNRGEKVAFLKKQS